MLETDIDVVIEGIAHKKYREGYADGLKRAHTELADITADLFIDGETETAVVMRSAYTVMRGLERAARSDHDNESIGYLQNSAASMQRIINDYIRTENDNSAD